MIQDKPSYINSLQSKLCCHISCNCIICLLTYYCEARGRLPIVITPTWFRKQHQQLAYKYSNFYSLFGLTIMHVLNLFLAETSMLTRLTYTVYLLLSCYYKLMFLAFFLWLLLYPNCYYNVEILKYLTDLFVSKLMNGKPQRPSRPPSTSG